MTGIEVGATLAGIVWGLAVATASIAAGAGVAYLGARADNTEVMGLGAAIAVGGSLYGFNAGRRTTADALRDGRQRLDPAETYRFVRFLPEYAWLGSTDEPAHEPWRFVAGDEVAAVGCLHPDRASVSAVAPRTTICHFPDVDRRSADPAAWLTDAQAFDAWAERFATALGAAGEGDGWRRLAEVALRHAGAESDHETPRGRPCLLELEPRELRLIVERGIFAADHELVIDVSERRVSIHPVERSFFVEEDPEALARLVYAAALAPRQPAQP